MVDQADRTGAVVIGQNEGARLVRCLASLHAVRGRLVYVDSASTDGSICAAHKAGAEVLSLDLGQPFTAARARSEGLELLESLVPSLEYVMFIDGDCVVESGWLEAAISFLDEHPKYGVACGRRRECSPKASRYNAWVEREWNTPTGEATACGGDAVMRCAALRAVGGFDAAMIAGEEPELCRRLRAAGWRIMRLDVPMTIHDAAMSRLGQWWKRAIRSGFGYAQAWHRTRGNAKEAPLYRRELARAVAWAGLLPLSALLLGVLLDPLLLLPWPLATAAQYLRIRRRDGRDVAALSVIGKFAELVGALRYFRRVALRSVGGTIAYK